MFNITILNFKKEKENIICYTRDDILVHDFSFNKKAIKHHNPLKPYLLEIPSFLDTETSWNHSETNPIGWVYQWAFEFDGHMFVGRTPTDFTYFLDFFIEKLNLVEEQRKMVIYVHNLSYDFQFLRDFLNKKYGIPKILATKPHKIISAEYPHFIFKCSYFLSNANLFDWGNAYQTNHRKQVGFVDYKKIHFQDEELTKKDWIYQLCDVLTMKDCYYATTVGYDIQTVPLTSTGFVRNDTRKEFKKDRKNRKEFESTQLNETVYSKCRDLFSGGYTHGNRYFCGDVVE